MSLYQPLPPRTEWLLTEIVDSGIKVHKAIGHKFFERIYRNALCVELDRRKIPFEVEKAFVVRYDERPVGTQRIDLVVEEAVIVEVKAVDALARVHDQQVLSYLRATGLRAGLLMNFGGLVLAKGLKRFVL